MRLVRPLLAAVLLLAACGGEAATTTSSSTTETTLSTMGCDGEPIVPGGEVTCEVPGWPDRLVAVHVPLGYDPAEVWPVVVALHGGGNNRADGIRVTCPESVVSDPGCLDNLGDREGFFTVSPDGTAELHNSAIRTWNAGGSGDLDCVIGTACADEVDDVAYVRDMLDMLATHYALETRVVVTGFSNGGALAHRLGCELSDRVRVVAAVGGASQLPGCVPDLPVSILQIHGSDDPIWPYQGGTVDRQPEGIRVRGVEDTMEDWAAVLDCGSFVESTLPDTADDEMTTVRRDAGCADGVRVALVIVQGGGHTWPQGYQFAAVSAVGVTTWDFNANELIWEFASG